MISASTSGKPWSNIYCRRRHIKRVLERLEHLLTGADIRERSYLSLHDGPKRFKSAQTSKIHMDGISSWRCYQNRILTNTGESPRRATFSFLLSLLTAPLPAFPCLFKILLLLFLILLFLVSRRRNLSNLSFAYLSPGASLVQGFC